MNRKGPRITPMPEIIVENYVRETEEVKRITEWRRDYLVRSGWDAEAADLIAREMGVDLHRAGALLERGCDPTTALLILL